MPPRKHNDKAPSARFQIDPDKIPAHHRETIDISSNLELKLVMYNIHCGICYVRGCACSNGPVIGHKRVISVPKKPSINNFFLLTFVDGGYSTKLVLNLYDIYLYGITCNGRWYYPLKSKYTIKGGTEAAFGESYPGNQLHIGIDTLRLSVSNLHHNDSRKWGQAYYDMAANVAESVRFHFVLQKLLGSEPGIETELPPDFRTILNNWAALSKMWKLFCRYNKWNPQHLQFFLDDPAVARSLLCVVKNMDIREEIDSLEPKNRAVDRNVK